MMVAASAGGVDVIRYLIEIGADKSVSTSAGISALSLVESAKIHGTVKRELRELLRERVRTEKDEDDDDDDISCLSSKNKSTSSPSVIHFCDTCDSCYAESEVEHAQSVSHLLKLNGVGKNAAKPDLSVFEIAGDNRGFKLMVDKMGWDANSGLGKEGEGRRYG